MAETKGKIESWALLEIVEGTDMSLLNSRLSLVKQSYDDSDEFYYDLSGLLRDLCYEVKLFNTDSSWPSSNKVTVVGIFTDAKSNDCYFIRSNCICDLVFDTAGSLDAVITASGSKYLLGTSHAVRYSGEEEKKEAEIRKELEMYYSGGIDRIIELLDEDYFDFQK